MRYNIIKDEKYGYKKLNPIPNEDELKEFYNKQYYKIKSESDTGSIDRFAKLKENNQEKKRELEWLKATEFKDFYDLLRMNFYSSRTRILDVGCGTGELLKYMSDISFECVGIEPSKEAYEKAKDKQINVYNCDLIGYYKKYFNNNEKFNVINLNNVLEHVVDPVCFIRKCKEMISKNGIIRIKVPNDFNKLQLQFKSKFNKEEWWVSIPDHINYFDFESLISLVLSQGFEVLHKTVDFPMEVFLLMEQDYLNDSSIGRMCHKMRKNFELNISKELRNEIYQSFANINLGRNIILYVKSI